MGHRHHHHHHHHRRYGCSNCCIALNAICFLICLIAGAVIVVAVLRPSVEYIDEWTRHNCTMTGYIMTPSCHGEACKESTNQITFPKYFYDNGKRFPYEYDADDAPPPFTFNTTSGGSSSTSINIVTTTTTGTTSGGNSSSSDSNSTSSDSNNGSHSSGNNTHVCPNSQPVECWNGTIEFSYHPERGLLYNQSLYVYGTYDNAYDFVGYFDQVFHCWVKNDDYSQVSVIPIPKYSPGGAIATGVLFSISLLCLVLLIIFISVRCLCKNRHEYQPINSSI